MSDTQPTSSAGTGGNGTTNGLHVGRRMRRKEDPPLIQGKGTFIDDIQPGGMLHAAFVRSTEAHARIASIDTSAAAARPGIQAVFTGDDLDLEAGLPLAWVPPGVEVKAPDHWPLAKDAVKHVGDPVAVVIGRDRYAVVDAAEDVLVDYDPLPAVVDPEAALEGAPFVHDDLGTNKVHEWSLGGDVESALARLRRRRGAPLHQPPHRGRADRDARRDRRLPRRRADGHELHPGAALPQALPRPPAGDDRGPRAGDRPRRGRRLRLQAPDLRRGDPARLGVAPAEPAGQVDRDALGEHGRLPPRPRPDRLREDRRQAGRHVHRPAREDHRGLRRVHDAADAADPVAGRIRDDRLLPLGRGPDGHHGGDDQQDGHGRDPRRRAARGHPLHRGHDRPARPRAGDGPARYPAQELHPRRGLPGGDRDRDGLRLGQLPGHAGQAARALRPGGRARKDPRRQAPRGRLLDLDRDLRPRALAGDRPERARRPGRPDGVGAGARARHGRGHRLHGHVAARPGARDGLRPDRGRPARGRPRAGRGHARRHLAGPAGPGHLRLALAGRGRRGDRPRDRQGGGEGEGDRRAQAGGGARGHRGARGQVRRRRLARLRPHARRDRGLRLHPRGQPARGPGARPGGPRVLRPGELRVPVRGARRGRRGRPGDRQDRPRPLHRGRRLRPGDQPEPDRRPDPRRHRPRRSARRSSSTWPTTRTGSSPRARSSTTRCPSAAELPSFETRPHGDAVARQLARREGRRRGGHDRGERRGHERGDRRAAARRRRLHQHAPHAHAGVGGASRRREG